jgi:hypothetical protein
MTGIERNIAGEPGLLPEANVGRLGDGWVAEVVDHPALPSSHLHMPAAEPPVSPETLVERK